MLILSAICMLGFSASMGSGSVSLFLMIAFYALSGFSRVPAVRAVTPPSPNGRRVVNAGHSSVSGTFLTTLVVQAQQVWRCSAQITCSMVMSSACLFPVDYRADCWFYRSALRQRLPGILWLGKAEELFGEEISEEDKETESTDMTKWQIFVEYVLKTK